MLSFLNERVRRFPLLILMSFVLAACQLTPTNGSNASVSGNIAIIAPPDGSQLEVGAWVDVQSRIQEPGGARTVALSVNDVLLRRDEFSTPMYDGVLKQPWHPMEPGVYTLQAILETSQGEIVSSQPVTVTVAGEEVVVTTPPSAVPTTAVPTTVAPTTFVPTMVTITVTPSLTPTETVTPTLGPPMVTAEQDANCRYGPGQVYEVIGYLLSGQSALIQGRNAETTWWLIKQPDTSGNCWIWDGLVTLRSDTSNVPVLQAPPTPTFTPKPLNAPQPLSPQGTLSCADTTTGVTLTWEAVSHPNGIDHYEWELEGGEGAQTGTTSATQAEIASISCGYSYQWRVRAVGSNGRVGPYSNDRSFTID